MKEEIFDNIYQAMVKYDDKEIERLVNNAINMNIDPIKTIDILTNTILEIGERFGKGELFLPDLMLAAKTMQIAMVPLKGEILKKGLKVPSKGRIVIGTVYGDLHSIGKGLVATLLNANGFEVIDLGVNVRANSFIESINSNSPDIIAMSALLTTTAPEMEHVIDSLKKTGIRNKIKVIVGGGPITQEFADDIGADGYEPTAVLAVELVKKLLNSKK
jgi:5-methyltetrahydrofolate--homocysteine methyltransferase